MLCTLTIKVSSSGLEVTPIGVGAWSWGDRSGYWGSDLASDTKKAENFEAYKALVDSGIGLIDTAEVGLHKFVPRLLVCP